MKKLQPAICEFREHNGIIEVFHADMYLKKKSTSLLLFTCILAQQTDCSLSLTVQNL